MNDRSKYFAEYYQRNKMKIESEEMFELRKLLYSSITEEMVEKIKERLLGFKQGEVSYEVKALLTKLNIDLPNNQERK